MKHGKEEIETTPTISGNNDKIWVNFSFRLLFFVPIKIKLVAHYRHASIVVINYIDILLFNKWGFLLSNYHNNLAVNASSVCKCNFILILLTIYFGEKIEHFEYDYPTQRQYSHTLYWFICGLLLFCCQIFLE